MIKIHAGQALASAALAVALGSTAAAAKDITVCLLAGKTGPLEAYAKQTEAGFMMGLEYLTKGTMKIGADSLHLVIFDRRPEYRAKPWDERLGREAHLTTAGKPVAVVWC